MILNSSLGLIICLNLTRLTLETLIFRLLDRLIASKTIPNCAIPGRTGSPGKCPENQGESGGT
jgi:hypothetical protein